MTLTVPGASEAATLPIAVPEELPTGIAVLGGPGARLFDGPPGAESLAAHLDRLDRVPLLTGSRHDRLATVDRSGLGGRGGSGFPVARKMAAVAAADGRRLLVVNGAESEPASRKDQTLLRMRPHLVLDGAVWAAAAVGAPEVTLVLHRGDLTSRRAVHRALRERAAAGLGDPPIDVVDLPPRYVAGESSAIVSFLEGGEAKPRFDRRAVQAGVRGRPTLLHNVETVAHLALIARFGPDWFRGAGTDRTPGTALVTVSGGVARPGTVVEITAPVTLGALLRSVGGVHQPPPAVLVGGYAGAWVDGRSAWTVPTSRDGFAAAGLPFGCGLIGSLPPTACGLRETARLLDYLAGESAGQCGPCVFGLPALAMGLTAVVAGRGIRRQLAALHRRAAAVTGRGACRHPDGAVALLESALQVFADDITRHSRHGGCGAGDSQVFPLPSSAERSGWR